MGDGIRVFGPCDLYHPLGDQRSRDACSEKILALVDRGRLKHRKHEIASEFIPKVVDYAFGCAGAKRFFFQSLEFFLLSDVSTEGDDLRLVIFLQPAKNDRGVETAGVSENNFHG